MQEYFKYSKYIHYCDPCAKKYNLKCYPEIHWYPLMQAAPCDVCKQLVSVVYEVDHLRRNPS